MTQRIIHFPCNGIKVQVVLQLWKMSNQIKTQFVCESKCNNGEYYFMCFHSFAFGAKRFKSPNSSFTYLATFINARYLELGGKLNKEVLIEG